MERLRSDASGHSGALFAERVKSKFIRLDKYLVDKKLADSRTQAQSYIEAGRVTVNGQKNLKAASQISPDASIKVDTPEKQWVSRGAHKLIKGLDYFAIDPEGCVCVDVGASTGGFTDVLLERGAAKVFAVDVGYGQLAWKLRANPRVIVMERTNARYLTTEMLNGEKADIIVSDASFISLKLLLTPLASLLKKNGRLVALVKPQFEVGKERVGKGVVTDPRVHREVLEEIASFATNQAGLILVGATFSPIRGPEGNIEFLFEFVLPGTGTNRNNIDFAAVVEEAHEKTVKD